MNYRNGPWPRRRDQRVRDHAPNRHWNITIVIGSAGLDGTIGCMAVDGATTRDVFREYVRQALCPALWSGGIVVVDNLSAHKDGESEAF